MRAKRTIGTRQVQTDARVAKLERRPAPVRLAENSVDAESLAPGAVVSATIPDSSIASVKLTLPWNGFVPVLGGTGWTQNNGAFTGSFVVIDNTVHFHIRFVSGNTTAFGSASPTLTLPTPMASGFAGAHLLEAKFYDSSAGRTYTAVPLVTSTSLITVSAMGTAGVDATANSTTPFTWANPDEIWLAGTYEIP